MNYFFPALMAVTIGAGLILTVTPYVATLLFPPTAVSFQKPAELEVRRALADWFGAGMDEITEAHAMRQRQASSTLDWYRFGMPRSAVERFVIVGQLRQLDLSDEIMQQTFLNGAPAVDWWQPKSLMLETYFLGIGDGREVALIYNAELEQGYLRIYSQRQPAASAF